MGRDPVRPLSLRKSTKCVPNWHIFLKILMFDTLKRQPMENHRDIRILRGLKCRIPMFLYKSVTLHVLTPDLAEKLPGRECFAPFREPNPQHPSSGPRGEVQWLFGSSKTFEIGSGLKVFGILEIPKWPPKLLNATLLQHECARDLETNETRGDGFEHGDFE